MSWFFSDPSHSPGSIPIQIQLKQDMCAAVYCALQMWLAISHTLSLIHGYTSSSQLLQFLFIDLQLNLWFSKFEGTLLPHYVFVGRARAVT